jgi:hypothetical protein
MVALTRNQQIVAELKAFVPPSIKIELRDVYGATRAYPKCPQAVIFAQIAGAKTLTSRVIWQAMRLGFDVVVVDRAGNVSVTVPRHVAGDGQDLPAPLNDVD